MNRLTLAKTCDTCTSEDPKYAVILIHGINSSSASYDDAIKYIAEEKKIPDLRVIAFDLLGSGKSLQSDELSYDYEEQMEALTNSIEDLNLEIPIILVGHSMGTFIATRYVKENPGKVQKLILISPPIYTKADLANPAMAVAMDAFKKSLMTKNPEIDKSKAFNNEIKYIVLNPDNYQRLVEIDVPTTMIWGELDKIIASYNIPRVLKTNKNITAILTPGTHGIKKDKYLILARILAKMVKEQDAKTI